MEISGLGRPRWHSPDPCPTSFPPTVAWGDYAGALKRLVVAHKDADRLDAGRILAALLAVVIDLALDTLERPVLVPIPSSAAARRHRGRDPLLEMLQRTKLVRPVPVAASLHQQRRVSDQARLGHAERRVNVHGSIAVRAGWSTALRGADIVLIDDVVTTGATLAEATRAVIEHPALGASVSSVCAAAICATQRTAPPGSLASSSASPGDCDR